MSRVQGSIDLRLSDRQERQELFIDEIKTFVDKHGVSSYDRVSCRRCPGEYPLAIGVLTEGQCVPCYAESRGILVIDEQIVMELEDATYAKPHYVRDDANPSWENAVRFFEDNR